jgi:hypothetical protein
MNTANDLLDRLAEVGATVRSDGDDRLLVRAGANPIPADLVRRLREAKAEVLAMVAPAGHPSQNLGPGGSERAWWQRHFIIRTIGRQLDGYRSHREAELHAFGDMIVEWHRRHGARSGPRRCAGCNDELPDFAGIVVDRDGVRVHFDAARHNECIIAYGQRWRRRDAGFDSYGVAAPRGWGRFGTCLVRWRPRLPALDAEDETERQLWRRFRSLKESSAGAPARGAADRLLRSNGENRSSPI